MSFKTTVRVFIKEWVLPPMILYFLNHWIFSVALRHHFSTVRLFKKRSRKLFVLANGPSLNNDYEKYKNEIFRNDTVVMNMFALSQLFEQIKPEAYVLSDPVYFKSIVSLSTNYIENIRRLRKAFIDKVNWHMTLFVPDSANGCEFLNVIGCNAYISVRYYNSRPGIDGHFGLWLLKNEKTSPPAQTVATVAAGIGIILGYEEIYMLGIDTSMHTMMRVNQRTNEVYFENAHFYGTRNEKAYKEGDENQAYSVAFFLECVAKMFDGYDRIRKFADYCGVRVINASSFSWVDSLERR